MNIFVGVTTYNRLTEVQTMSKSLFGCSGISDCTIRVFDDCSTEYSIEDLRALFPSPTGLERRVSNLGASMNMHKMFLDFLTVGADVLIVADSDLIFNPGAIQFIKRVFPSTEGVLSLYNSAFHHGSDETVIAGEYLVRKDAIGAAGAVFAREVIIDIVKKVPVTIHYDWGWSSFLSKRGTKIWVARDSQVQHIGITGVNCNGVSIVDFGLNFSPGSDFNLEVLLRFFQESMLMNARAVQAGIDPIVEGKLSKIRENIRLETISEVRGSLTYRVGNWILSPMKLFRRGMNSLRLS